MSPIPISSSTDEIMMGAVAISSGGVITSANTIPATNSTIITPKLESRVESEPSERPSPTSCDSELQQQQPSSSTTEAGISPIGVGGGGPPSPKHGYGTLIPNRVFVGGISTHTTEAELAGLFSKYGAVRGAKIILDRAGISKGYGFITFETEEEARRLFTAMNNRELAPIVHRDRRLNIAPAVKKQPILRQGGGGGSSLYGSSSAASTTVSPPPTLEPFYFPGAVGGAGGEFLLPPPPPAAGYSAHDFLYPQPSPFSPFFHSAAAAGTTPTGAAATTHHHPGLGLGQALPGPNGSIIFLPLGLPYQAGQQSFTTASATDLWNGGVGGSGNLASFGLPLPLQPNHTHPHPHQFAPWSPRIHPHHSHYPPHSSASSISGSGPHSSSSSTHPHPHAHHHHGHHHHHPLSLNSLSHNAGATAYLSSGSGGDPLGNNSADQLLYFSNALISSPH